MRHNQRRPDTLSCTGEAEGVPSLTSPSGEPKRLAPLILHHKRPSAAGGPLAAPGLTSLSCTGRAQGGWLI